MKHYATLVLLFMIAEVDVLIPINAKRERGRIKREKTSYVALEKNRLTKETINLNRRIDYQIRNERLYGREGLRRKSSENNDGFQRESLDYNTDNHRNHGSSSSFLQIMIEDKYDDTSISERSSTTIGTKSGISLKSGKRKKIKSKKVTKWKSPKKSSKKSPKKTTNPSGDDPTTSPTRSNLIPTPVPNKSPQSGRPNSYKSKKSKGKGEKCYTYGKGKSKKSRKKKRVPCSGTLDPTMAPTPDGPIIKTPSPSQDPANSPAPSQCDGLDCERPTNPTDNDYSRQTTLSPTRSNTIPEPTPNSRPRDPSTVPQPVPLSSSVPSLSPSQCNGLDCDRPTNPTLEEQNTQ